MRIGVSGNHSAAHTLGLRRRHVVLARSGELASAHAGAPASKERIRTRLYAALVKVKSQATFSRPR